MNELFDNNEHNKSKNNNKIQTITITIQLMVKIMLMNKLITIKTYQMMKFMTIIKNNNKNNIRNTNQ